MSITLGRQSISCSRWLSIGPPKLQIWIKLFCRCSNRCKCIWCNFVFPLNVDSCQIECPCIVDRFLKFVFIKVILNYTNIVWKPKFITHFELSLMKQSMLFHQQIDHITICIEILDCQVNLKPSKRFITFTFIYDCWLRL